MNAIRWKITTSPNDLKEGLFGQVILWTFEVLPYLAEKSIFPEWDIKSKLYGTEPNYTVIPGVFDLAYTPDSQINKVTKLLALRASCTSTLGGDWDYLHQLWHSYFRVPERIKIAADRIGIPQNTLGIHYRGTDKNRTLHDTNPVSQKDFLTLVKGFLKEHQQIESIFIATDEFSFVQNAQQQLPQLKVINLGEVEFHKANQNSTLKADRALLDCVLLSRCQYLLKCSSALSGFAKVLNPQLEAYRIAASKLGAEVPYTPDAYIPKLTSSDSECRKILEGLFTDDWLDNSEASQQFGKPFQARLRYTPCEMLKNQIKFFVKDRVKLLLLRQ